MLGVLVDRLDGVDVTLVRHGADIEKTQKDVDSLTASVARMQAQADKGQPDWLKIADPDEAETWLTGALVFVERYLMPMDVDLPACWPWHPFLVSEIIALAEQRDLAYAGTADKVSDYHARWLKTFKDRVGNAKREGCGRITHADRDGTKYDIDRSRVREYARWWATDRVSPPPGLSKR